MHRRPQPSRAAANLAALVLTVGLVYVGQAAAGAGPSAASGKIAPVESPGQFAVPEHFTYSVNGRIPGNTKLDIALNCSQSGVWKWQFVDWADQTDNPGLGWLTGGPGSSWSTDGGHPSTCTATLFYYATQGKTTTLVNLASVTFPLACAATDTTCT